MIVDAFVLQEVLLAVAEVADAEFVEDKDGYDGGGEGDEASAAGSGGVAGGGRGEEWVAVAGAVVAAASESHGGEWRGMRMKSLGHLVFWSIFWDPPPT